MRNTDITLKETFDEFVYVFTYLLSKYVRIYYPNFPNSPINTASLKFPAKRTLVS